MTAMPQTGTPLEVPLWLHLLLWPALVGWVFALRSARKRHRWLRSAWVGFPLAVLCFVVDAATLAAAFVWPTATANSFVFALLWLAVLCSVTAYLVLRRPDGGDDGGSGPEAPEPPWWPEFERQFRDYARQRRRPRSGAPRSPSGAR
jgi:hypothetical protein